MLYTVSADALQGFRLMLATSAHEGVELGGAAVPGGQGGPQRRVSGGGKDGGGAGGGGGGGGVSARRWHHRQGPHRGGRPLEVLCFGSPDASRTDQQGV